MECSKDKRCAKFFRCSLWKGQKRSGQQQVATVFGIVRHQSIGEQSRTAKRWAKQAANLVGQEPFANLQLQEQHPLHLPCVHTQSASRCSLVQNVAQYASCDPPGACERAGAPRTRTAQRLLDLPGRRQMARQWLLGWFLLAGRTFGSSDGRLAKASGSGWLSPPRADALRTEIAAPWDAMARTVYELADPWCAPLIREDPHNTTGPILRHSLSKMVRTKLTLCSFRQLQSGAGN